MCCVAGARVADVHQTAARTESKLRAWGKGPVLGLKTSTCTKRQNQELPALSMVLLWWELLIAVAN